MDDASANITGTRKKMKPWLELGIQKFSGLNHGHFSLMPEVASPHAAVKSCLLTVSALVLPPPFTWGGVVMNALFLVQFGLQRMGTLTWARISVIFHSSSSDQCPKTLLAEITSFLFDCSNFLPYRQDCCTSLL